MWRHLATEATITELADHLSDMGMNRATVGEILG